MSDDDTEIISIGSRVSLETIERLHIEAVINNTASLGEAAKVLKIDPATLYRKRKLWEKPQTTN